MSDAAVDSFLEELTAETVAAEVSEAGEAPTTSPTEGIADSDDVQKLLDETSALSENFELKQSEDKSEMSTSLVIGNSYPVTKPVIASTTAVLEDAIEDNYHETLCAVCETGGALVCCQGRCLRSFHLKCIGLQDDQLESLTSFQCSDCANKVQRCFQCKEFQLESNLHCCSVEFCGKFYHGKCMSTNLDRSVSGDICPIHTCAGCGELVTDSVKRKYLVRCFRCPKSYHLKCRPRDLHNLGLGLFLCIAHANESMELPALPPGLIETKDKFKNSNFDSRNSPRANNTDNEDLYFTPGVIVRLDGIRAGTHVFAIKDALKDITDVRFIEFNEDGDTWALARVGDSRSAAVLIAAANSTQGICVPHTRAGARSINSLYHPPSFPTARVLSGDEEIEYWRNAKADEKGRRKRPDSLADDRATRRFRTDFSTGAATRGAQYGGTGSYYSGTADRYSRPDDGDNNRPYLSRTSLALGTSSGSYGSRYDARSSVPATGGFGYDQQQPLSGYAFAANRGGPGYEGYGAPLHAGGGGGSNMQYGSIMYGGDQPVGVPPAAAYFSGSRETAGGYYGIAPSLSRNNLEGGGGYYAPSNTHHANSATTPGGGGPFASYNQHSSAAGGAGSSRPLVAGGGSVSIGDRSHVMNRGYTNNGFIQQQHAGGGYPGGVTSTTNIGGGVGPAQLSHSAYQQHDNYNDNPYGRFAPVAGPGGSSGREVAGDLRSGAGPGGYYSNNSANGAYGGVAGGRGGYGTAVDPRTNRNFTSVGGAGPTSAYNHGGDPNQRGKVNADELFGMLASAGMLPSSASSGVHRRL